MTSRIPGIKRRISLNQLSRRSGEGTLIEDKRVKSAAICTSKNGVELLDEVVRVGDTSGLKLKATVLMYEMCGLVE